MYSNKLEITKTQNNRKKYIFTFSIINTGVLNDEFIKGN